LSIIKKLRTKETFQDYTDIADPLDTVVERLEFGLADASKEHWVKTNLENVKRLLVAGLFSTDFTYARPDRRPQTKPAMIREYAKVQDCVAIDERDDNVQVRADMELIQRLMTHSLFVSMPGLVNNGRDIQRYTRVSDEGAAALRVAAGNLEALQEQRLGKRGFSADAELAAKVERMKEMDNSNVYMKVGDGVHRENIHLGSAIEKFRLNKAKFCGRNINEITYYNPQVIERQHKSYGAAQKASEFGAVSELAKKLDSIVDEDSAVAMEEIREDHEKIAFQERSNGVLRSLRDDLKGTAAERTYLFQDLVDQINQNYRLVLAKKEELDHRDTRRSNLTQAIPDIEARAKVLQESGFMARYAALEELAEEDEGVMGLWQPTEEETRLYRAAKAWIAGRAPHTNADIELIADFEPASSRTVNVFEQQSDEISAVARNLLPMQTGQFDPESFWNTVLAEIKGNEDIWTLIGGTCSGFKNSARRWGTRQYVSGENDSYAGLNFKYFTGRQSRKEYWGEYGSRFSGLHREPIFGASGEFRIPQQILWALYQDHLYGTQFIPIQNVLTENEYGGQRQSGERGAVLARMRTNMPESVKANQKYACFLEKDDELCKVELVPTRQQGIRVIVKYKGADEDYIRTPVYQGKSSEDAVSKFVDVVEQKLGEDYVDGNLRNDPEIQRMPQFQHIQRFERIVNQKLTEYFTLAKVHQIRNAQPPRRSWGGGGRRRFGRW